MGVYNNSQVTSLKEGMDILGVQTREKITLRIDG